jgi:hypothetical protein
MTHIRISSGLQLQCSLKGSPVTSVGSHWRSDVFCVASVTVTCLFTPGTTQFSSVPKTKIWKSDFSALRTGRRSVRGLGRAT